MATPKSGSALALEPYRKKVFLACKTGKRDAAGAEEELQASLKRLHTDHFDLYQLHAVSSMDDVEKIMAPGGALETFVKARERGLTRFLGFSAHSEEAAIALMDRFAFDTILFPFNWVCWLKNNFGPAVLTHAKEKGMGILALKSLAKHKWESETRAWAKCWYHPADTAEEAALGLRFTLSRPITAAPTPGHEHLFNWACDAAEHFTPITPAEEAELARRAQALEPIFPH